MVYLGIFIDLCIVYESKAVEKPRPVLLILSHCIIQDRLFIKSKCEAFFLITAVYEGWGLVWVCVLCVV